MATSPNVLERHLGVAFERLAPLLQAAHQGHSRLQGIVRVERGNWVARLICDLFQMPPAREHCPLIVDCEHDPDGMLWRRSFDGFEMTSHFRRDGDYLVESLGPLKLYFEAVERDAALEYRYLKTRLCGIPLPGILSPGVVAGERQQAAHYCFSVRVSLFPVGLLIAYSGQLDLVEAT